jgi:isopenicillin N synthase-like dioxygenase
VPVIDLSDPEEVVVQAIAKACATYGFFQLTSHGIPQDLIADFREQMRLYFDLPHETKVQWKRDEQNARGFFDDELTKQKRDWKECLDVGVPGSRDWSFPDDDPSNACLDGYNRFPPSSLLPHFRSVVVDYFEQCTVLSEKLALLMGKGLGMDKDPLLANLSLLHTSYLRMNYYPPCREEEPLGISPHHDAGFLTVLLQDDDCHSLQVLNGHNEWVTVEPVPGGVTINTGDMAMIWSNGAYRAPLHRVLTDECKVRYSAPFFYNPPYTTKIAPFCPQEECVYDPCLWGYFRAVRFAGDLTDFGVEIQSSDYKRGRKSPHLKKQARFEDEAHFHEPFSVEKYRPLLQDSF